MNRQILFRGKTIEKDEWVEGYLVQGQWYYADSPMTVIIPTDITFYPRCEISSYEDVDPKTVGQWTGLVDKNGKKIFEGDIVECTVTYDVGCYPYSITESREVVYRDGCFYPLHRCERNSCEVVGNKWDNPELLKE